MSQPSAAAARTSPRLDASAAFFAGVPAHAVHACASYFAAQPVPPAASSSTTAGPPDAPLLKRFLLTASAAGELVHWSYLPSVGFTARALLIPPTSTAASGALVSGGEGHRRSHWQPSLPGSSLACSASYPAPTLSSASCVVSTRVANKDVFVVADRCGGVAQWSVDGDCCFCAARLCPFPVSQLRIVHSRPYGAGSAPITFAICASDVSNTVCIIDLLQMHVVRYIDIDSAQAVQLPDQANAESRREDEGPQQPLGVACMDLRSVACHDSCMVPSLLESEHLVLLSTRGRLSVWDLTSIIRSTMQLSSDASSSSSRLGGSISDSSPRPTKRRVNASMSGAFFASLPPLDVSHHSACISAPLARLSFLASPLVSMRVFSAPMPAHLDVAVYNTVAFILLVMQRHFIVLHADTYAPVIPLQTLRDLAPKTPPQPQPQSPTSPAPSSLLPLSSHAASSSSSSLEVPSGWNLPLPLPPSPQSSKRPSISVASPAHAHEHTVECQLLGGMFLFPPEAASSDCANIVSCAAPPSILLWSSCGCAWACTITAPSPLPGAPSLQRQHSAPTASVAPINTAAHPHDSSLHSSLRVVATLQLPLDALVAPSTSTSDLIASGPSFCAHVPETSGDLFHPLASDDSSLSLLFGTRAGRLLEYALPLEQLRAPHSVVLHPKHVSHFTDAFATPSYVHRFLRPAAQRKSSKTASDIYLRDHPHAQPHHHKTPTLHPTLASSCSSLLFDLLYHRDDGMKSLLVLLVQGFDSGRMHFFKLLNSAVPSSASGVRTPYSPMSPVSPSLSTNEAHAVSDASLNSDSFHALQAHSARITAIVSFQAAESLFAIPLLVSASLDGTVAMWEARTTNLLFRLHAPSPILDLTRPTQPPLPQQYPPIDSDASVAPAVRTREGGVMCSDMTLVCAICADLSVRLLSVEKMGWVACLRGHDSIPRAVFRDAWATSADVVLVQTARGSIFVWSISSSTLEEVLEGGSDDGLECVWRFPMFAGAAAPLPKLTPATLARSISGTLGGIPTPSRSRVVSNTDASGVPDSPTLLAPRRAKSNSDFAALGGLDSTVAVRASSSLQGISELTAEEDLASRPFSGATAKGSPSRSPPPAPAPAHSTAILSSSSDDPNLTPPRLARATTAPHSRRPSYLTPIVTSVPSAASPQPSAAAAIPWAVHYGLQRLWKLGGRGGLWGTTGSAGSDDGSSGSHSLQSASFGGGSSSACFGASSNLICSFESLPALHLNVLSVDIGFLTAEMRQRYAPLNATSDRSVVPAATAAGPDDSDAPVVTLETKHRAEVYKEILKLLLDWSDDDEPALDTDEDKPSSASAHSSKGVPGSRLSAKTDLLHILRDQFHMRPPFSGGRDRASSAHGGSLPTCYASYSPTNNALSILLPRACSVRANRELVASATHSPAAAAMVGLELSHLSRWSIGSNFTATHSLCLTTVLLSLLGSSDIQLHNYYSLIENFYNATLPALQPCSNSNSSSSLGSTHPVPSICWRYTEADLPFLASYALHEHDDIRCASKLLIQGLIGRVGALADLEAWSREWGSFYDQMGRPPALPWADTSMADPTAAPSFPAPPRLVSDFEFMTCMLLCYLQQAASKKRAALALSMHREAAHQDAAAELQIQSHIRASSISSSAAKPPARRTSLEHAPVISLDSSMLTGLSLQVQPSPSRRMQALSAQEAKRDGESRSAMEADHEPSLTRLPSTLFPTAPIAAVPVDHTPFIVSTLLRLLSQTHQDPTIHSLPKSSICVELLIQGLTVSSHSLSFVSARALDEAIPESNPFWQQIPKHALEPLYRILFDLSFVQPTREAAGSAAAATAPSFGRRPSNGDLRAANSGQSSSASFSSTCRVLLFELAKFDLHAFIQWARCEMFGYPGVQSGSGVAVPGTDFNGADLPTAPSQIKKSVAAAAAAASAAVNDPLGPLIDAGSSGYASIKALQFDEYRVQLTSMLVTLPRKFSQRMSYALTHSLVDLLLHLLDPLIVAQTRTITAFIAGGPSGASAAPGLGGVGASTAAASAAAAHAAAFPHSLRTRLQYLISPLWSYLSSKCSYVAFSAATNKLALVENPRWLFSDHLSRLIVPAERRMFVERDGVSLLQQEPSIPVYDLSYASKWRTLDGCFTPFSDVDAISFSANGHLLASYSSHDGQTASLRVWSTDYESAGVGSGFFGTRLLLKAVFKVHPFCLQTIQLPAVPKPKPPPNAPFTSALLGLPQGPHPACAIRFNDVHHIRLTREDETTVTLTLAV